MGSVVLARPMSKLFRFYLPHFYSKSDVLIAPSKFTMNSLRKYGINSPIFVVSNGVETKKFRFSGKRREKFRKHYGIGENELVVYSVGQVILRKGIDRFVNLAKKFPNARFVWVGRRPFGFLSGNSRELKEIMDSAPSNVIFTGYVDDIIGAHCAGDIFLLPTTFENECIALLEAAAVARPIIASNIPVFDSWLFDKKNCLKASGEKDFESALRAMIKSRDLRGRLGKAALKTARERDIGAVSARLVEIYSGAIAGGKRHGRIKITVAEKTYLAFAFSLFALAGALIFVKDKLLVKLK
jgi:1,2-diacylglycerol-3-alpha-glucose alpha-1,2-glucosyltransferase